MFPIIPIFSFLHHIISLSAQFPHHSQSPHKLDPPFPHQSHSTIIPLPHLQHHPIMTIPIPIINFIAFYRPLAEKKAGPNHISHHQFYSPLRTSCGKNLEQNDQKSLIILFLRNKAFCSQP